MELKVGEKYNFKEISQWMGISANSFSKRKEKHLSELYQFFDYELIGKKIFIKEIYIEDYVKLNGKMKEQVKKKIDRVWSKEGLDTCKRVSEEIFRELKEEFPNEKITLSTINKYTREGKNELFGKANPKGYGIIGNNERELCIKYNYRVSPFSEEDRIKIERLKEIYLKSPTLDGKIIVKSLINNGEITKEEAWELFESIEEFDDNRFKTFLDMASLELGGQIVIGTRVTRNNVEFIDEENIKYCYLEYHCGNA